MAVKRRQLPDGSYFGIGLYDHESETAGPVCGHSWEDPVSEEVFVCKRKGLHICLPVVEEVYDHAKVGMTLLRQGGAEVPLVCVWQQTAAIKLLATKLWSDEAGRYVRRYNRCDIRIPRKNGKTWIMQFLVSWFLSKLEGVLIAVAAQTKEAAQDAIWHWIRQVGMLSVACQEQKVVVPKAKDANIRSPVTHSEAVLVAADGEKLRGPEYMLAVLDEVRSVPDARGWLDNATSGQGSLDEGLVVTATTASENPESFESERFLDLLLIDEDPSREPETLVLLWHLEEKANWRDKSNWSKVNPGLGTVKKWAPMERRFNKALGNPEDERAFRREELNQIVDELASPVDMARWGFCGKAPASREGCWDLISRADMVMAGADLSWGNDLSSLGLLARIEKRLLPLWQMSWMAEARARDLDGNTDGKVRSWVKAGVLEIVPDKAYGHDGDFVDYVARRMVEIIQELPDRVAVLGYDPALAPPAVAVWEDNLIHHVEVMQGPYLNDAIAKFEDDVKLERVRHGGDPLLTHAATRAAITRTGVRDFRQINKNVSRSKNQARVDPLVAICTAMHCLLKPELREPIAFPAFGS